MDKASIPNTTPRRETKLEKASRLSCEVVRTGPRAYRIGKHHLTVQTSDVACSCKGASFGNTCSHKFGLELFLSAERRAS